MNKKVLTLSTGMLLSTALAFSAIDPNDLKIVSGADFKSGNNYYVIADVTGNGLTDDDIMLSVVANADGKTINGSLTNTLGNISFDTKGISFKIDAVASQTQAGHTLYSLYSNDAGAYVAVDASGDVITVIEDTKAASANLWHFNSGAAASDVEKYSGDYTKLQKLNLNTKVGTVNPNLWIVADATNGKGYIADINGNAYSILFCEAQRSVSADDLNKFFNKKGFNLGVEYDTEDGELAENLFGGEGRGRIWAFEVNETTAGSAWDATQKAYKVSSADKNGKDLFIPEGIYFFTDRVLVDPEEDENLTATDTGAASKIDWKASTFIVVNPTRTVETTVPNRAEGQGFLLQEIKGSEFIFVSNTTEPKVGDVPVQNACFEIQDDQSGNANYPYAIALKKFYFQASSNDETTDLLTTDKPVYLGILPFDSEDVQYLTTIPGDINAAKHIFQFDNSAAVDARTELLNTEKKAAIYTIKFVDGLTADKDLFGKYLTVGVATGTNETVSGTKFEWVAKGSMVSELSHPAFQYTITAAEDIDPKDKSDVYQLVTFTNRETDQSFTAMLFKEEGTNRYSMAISKENGTTISTPFNVTPVKVDSNSYGVSKQTAQKFDENIIVELDKIEDVNEYAGFLNVDNEAIRTIRFARDKNDTSYKWYAGVIAKQNGDYTLKNGGKDYFVEDVYEAAQWQLIKADKANTIARTFVYNNTTTQDVDDEANGDKVSAYQYILRYVAEGTPTDWYLANNASNSYAIELTEYTPSFKDYDEGDDKFKDLTAQKFYVKENADGSISLFDINNAFDNNTNKKQVAAYNVVTTVDAKVNANGTISYVHTAGSRSALYAYTSSDVNLKTYLDGEAPNISLPGEEGHVTMQNGTASLTGDYISVNDKNEGIVIDETSDVLYLHVTDENAVVPSFYISKGLGEGSNGASERLFMYNPVDSVDYPVNMKYDPEYQLAEKITKVIFKAGTLDASRDTMTTSLKGEVKEVAMKADNESTWGGLNRFKFQIIETEDGDGLYNIRQANGSEDNKTVYVASNNEKLYFTTDKDLAMDVAVERVAAPTANESVSASEVKVIAVDGAINIKNAAGKNVVVSTILGQIVANEVLTSDNATISVPAGIAIVSVDGEEAVKVSVR